MTGILASIQNLFASILNTFIGIFNTALSGVEGVFALVGTLIANIADLAKGFVELILGTWNADSCCLNHSLDLPVSWIAFSVLRPSCARLRGVIVEERGQTDESSLQTRSPSCSIDRALFTTCSPICMIRESFTDFIVSRYIGNVVIIGVVIAALVGFSAYQQRRGKDTAMSKKLS